MKRNEGGSMALTFKASGAGGSFKGVPAGSHVAICDIVADLGIQPGSKAYPTPKRQVYIRFEIPAERVDFEKDGVKLEGPAVIGNCYTASMNEKAQLRKQLESWRGKRFTDEEAELFDVSSILGKACLLTVVEKQIGDRVYSNIAAIGPLPKGMQSPILETNALYYDSTDTEQLEALPQWIQDKIKNQVSPKEARTLIPNPEITDEDLPF